MEKGLTQRVMKEFFGVMKLLLYRDCCSSYMAAFVNTELDPKRDYINYKLYLIFKTKKSRILCPIPYQLLIIL